MPVSRFRPPLILVVDDDAGDQVLIQEALDASGIRKSVRVVGDGQEALEYLYRSGRYAEGEAPRPDLVLLDLNMPRVGGCEVAARVKADPALKAIPLVAFTTSGNEEDVAECYSVGVNSYVQKPTEFEHFRATLRDVVRYWLEISTSAPAR